MTDSTFNESLAAFDETLTAGASTARVERSAPSVRATSIGRFAILEQIGAGGMGEVFAAYDAQLDRKVALKVVHPSLAVSEVSQIRLQREARALARLSHPNVVAVFDTGFWEQQFFIAMEFVRGVTLKDWLHQNPDSLRPWKDVLEVFVSSGRGLAAMHEIGLIHRDFKPTNVLIDDHGRPRLIDFGLVGFEQDESNAAPAHLGNDNHLTMTGAVLGTPNYMSPEQFQGKVVSAASDQFSFCIALFEALYGCAPFVGATVQDRKAAVSAGALVSPPTRTGVPAELQAIVTRGLQHDPAARWPDMAGLLDALQAVLSSYDQGIDDPDARRTQRRASLAMVALGVTILGSGLALVGSGSIAFSELNALLTDLLVFSTTAAVALVLRSRWVVYRRARRLIGFYFLILTLFTVQDLVGYLSDRSLYHSVLGNEAVLATLCYFAALIEGPTLLWGGAWATVFTLLMIVDPSNYFTYFTLGNVGTALIVGLVHRRKRVSSSTDSADDMTR